MLDIISFSRYNELNKRQGQRKKYKRKEGTDHQKHNELPRSISERKVRTTENVSAFEFKFNQQKKT